MKDRYSIKQAKTAGKTNENTTEKTGKWYVWLELRFLRKQKLRTAALLCGMAFSAFLLTAFGSLGYDFWRQVHGEADGAVEYDSTQKILISLVVVLLLLVTFCAGILLRNLFSLTFSQRRRSLARLVSLGAGFRDMLRMEMVGTALLYGIAGPGGCLLAVLLRSRMGIRQEPPLWIVGGVLFWLLLLSCICGVRPLKAAFGRQAEKRARRGKKRAYRKTARPRFGFLWHVAGRYRHANRGQYLRITVSVIAAILLYVPAGYLIDANISVQQSGLHAKYGIQYNCSPQDWEELETALQEYQRLADCQEGGSMVCISLDTRAGIKTEAISGELRDALKEAGWTEDTGVKNVAPVLTVDANILFVDDDTFGQCLEISKSDGITSKKQLQTVNIKEPAKQDANHKSAPAILFNRYTNRSNWSGKEDVYFRETSLLADGADGSEAQIYYAFRKEYEPDTTKYIVPDMLIRELPEGIDFTGNLSLILPLGSIYDICPSAIAARFGTLHVCGKFEDEVPVFHRLEERLGENPLGRLTYTRRVLREWYASMEGIHRAMNAICLTLFSMAVLNIFSMMIFQYMERKRGLAILWSVGQSPGGLFRLLIMENITHFLIGIFAGIPLSAFLCYYIYRIFRRAWQVTFKLPVRQAALISIAALTVSAAALLLDGILLRRQNFLADIMEAERSME